MMPENFLDKTQKITRTLTQIKPVPSERFYSKMSRAPWQRKFSKTRLAFQISAAAVMLFLLAYWIPTSTIFISPPNTPTNTQVAYATPTQSQLHETTRALATPYLSSTPQP